MLAALGVWSSATGRPDIIVGATIALLFLHSASKILRQALGEWRSTRNPRLNEAVVATRDR
jgi:Co/Zn/Cd efflux system component